MRLRTVLAGLAAIFITHAASAVCQLKLAELKVTMAGLRPLVPVKVDGVDAMFLVDTGAFYSTISAANAARFGLRASSLPGEMRGIGGSVPLGVTTVKTFTIANTPVKNLEFVVGGNELGGEMAGIIGQNILSRFDVEYDLANGAIRLGIPHGCSGNLAYWAKDAPVSVLPFDPGARLNLHIVGNVKLNGTAMRALFDTGAQTTTVTLRAARRAGIRVDGPGVIAGGRMGGIGRKTVRSWVAPFDSVEIGGIKVLRTKLEVGDFDMDGPDLLVGDDFFLSNRIFVSNTQHRMYFTYNGGRMFNLEHFHEGAVPPTKAAASAAASDDPTDADGFARRGAALLARGEVERALTDLTRACELAPNEPRYRYRRAIALLDHKDLAAGTADLDRAIALKADDPEMLLLRFRLRLQAKNREGARADLDAASAELPEQADQRLLVAQGYETLDAFDLAVENYDRWIKVHADSSRYDQALNGRCWASALGNIGLNAGLAACDRAVGRTARAPNTLDSRGLMHLRRAEYGRAIADYDAALAKRPNMGWSLYGRGIAKLKSGDKPGGEADLAAAAKVAPQLAERAKGYGIAP